MSPRPTTPLPLLLLVLLLVAPAGAGEDEAEPVLAVVGARVVPVGAPEIGDGVVLLEGGKIRAVGARGEVAVPDGAEVLDATGLVATPGLVDAASGLFLSEAEAARASSYPDATVLDGVDPFDPDLPDVLRAGVTTVFVSPPAGRAVNGAGAAFRVLPDSPDGILVDGERAVHATLGASRGRDVGPIARITEVQGVAGVLRAADGYRKQRERYEAALDAWKKKIAALEKKREKEAKEAKEGGKAPAEGEAKKEEEEKPPERPVPPPPNPVAESLVPVLERAAPLRIRADGAEEILAALSLLDDFDVRLVLVGAAEAPRVLPEIVAARAAVVLGPLVADDPAAEVDEGLPKLLADAGVPFAVATFSRPGRASRFLALHAAAAARGGLPRDRALRAVTLDAARLSGVGDRLGSLAPGRDADLVLWTGHPVDTRSRPVRVIVAGETRWEERP